MVDSNRQLAINGGSRAFGRRTGRKQPKLGVEEFLSVAERFAFKPAALARIRRAISNDDFLGDGANLARYACPFPNHVPPKGVQFEQLACRKFGVPYALSVSSGTGALHAAFVGVGVGPGTEVICPGLGFAATSFAVALAGGVPVFADVDESLQIDPSKIEACITPRTVAIAPTHHWGNMAAMDPIMKIARKHGLKVVEDCAQGPGAKYRGRYIGSIGDAGCFSISAYKIIGGGEGGMVITRDRRIFERACQLAEGGGLWRPQRFAKPRYRGELFPGSNYRMSELEAAVDLVQLGKLEGVCGRYRHISQRVRRQLATFREVRPQTVNDTKGYIGYQLRFFPATFELAARIAKALNAEGISAGHRGRQMGPDWHVCKYMFPIVLKTGHIPGGSVFEDPRYIKRGGRVEYEGACPVAEDLFAREVAIPLDEWLSDPDCDAIARGINKVLAAYCTPDKTAKRWV